MHLMSLISPVDSDLAVVYSPLLPVPFREWLLGSPDRRLIDVTTYTAALAIHAAFSNQNVRV